MSAIADILLVIVAFIGEMLLWSFVGFYKMCRGLVLKTEREDLRRKWSKGPKEKAVLILGGLIWVPVFAVGFGVGLPLAYNVIRDSMKEKEEIELDLDGVAEFRMAHPENEDTEIIVRVDRSRLLELKKTKDVSDLVRKAREISDIKIQKKEAEQVDR